MMTKHTNNDTFMRITNSDIYKKLCQIEDHVKQTNGKVKLNRWIATTALTTSFMIIGLIISHIS